MHFFFIFLISCTFWTLDTLLRSSKFTKVLKNDLKTKYHMGCCTFWTLDTLLRSSKFTKVLKNDLKTKYHMGWSKSWKAKDSHSNIGQKIQYFLLSIFSNCFLKYILSIWKKRAPFCNKQLKEMFLLSSSMPQFWAKWKSKSTFYVHLFLIP